MITWTIIALAAMILAIALAGVMIPQILLISFRKNLFDEQDERKIHKGVVPRLGGIAFMPVVFIVMALIVGIGEWVDPVTVVNMMPRYIAPWHLPSAASLSYMSLVWPTTLSVSAIAPSSLPSCCAPCLSFATVFGSIIFGAFLESRKYLPLSVGR